jgi:multiple antibiotic resistance protein
MLQETKLHPYSFSQFDSRSHECGQRNFAAYAWRSRITSFVYQGVYRKRKLLTLIGTAIEVESCLAVAIDGDAAECAPRHKSLSGECRCYAVLPMTMVLLLFKFFAIGFSALLPLVNPLGSALVFVGFVGDAPASVYRDLAKKIAISTTIFMFVIELIGTGLLEFFGISLPVVQVAGGLVLASMGWNLLNQQESQTIADRSTVGEVNFSSIEQQVFYPLTFPVTVGPGCIVVMLTLTAHASVKSSVLANVVAHLGILAAVVALSLTVFFFYRYAPKITERVSPSTAHGILRIIAFVLLCIGVQITWNGMETLLRAVVHP